jgi:hypothetical protein
MEEASLVLLVHHSADAGLDSVETSFSGPHQDLTDQKRATMTTSTAVISLIAPAGSVDALTDRELTSAPAGSAPASEPHVRCPACGLPATIEWRDVVGSTSGPVVHVKVRCSRGRHWFLMPEEGL